MRLELSNGLGHIALHFFAARAPEGRASGTVH